MTKTFCDRCKVECEDEYLSIEVDNSPVKNNTWLDSSHKDYVLCPDCATALRAWLGEKKDD